MASEKRNKRFTTKWLESKAARKAGDHWDGGLAGFGLRVSPRGKQTFVLAVRVAGRPGTRRAIGHYPEMTLADAYAKARTWLALIERGIDPAEEEERARLAAQERRDATFAAVADDFLKHKVASERAAWPVERELRRDLLPSLGKRPVAQITDGDIRALVLAKKRAGTPTAARNMLALVKRMLAWAIEEGIYGLADNPARNIRPQRAIGKKVSRNRILSDDELAALWRVALSLDYPHGSVYQVLALTGQRLNEVARARWSEFDLKNGEWTIPASRMKAGREHVVPINSEIRELLAELPRFHDGDFLFSTDSGKSPIWMGSRIKERVDTLMREELGGAPLQPWRQHDVRRTVRTHLSRLRIPEVAAEALMAHARPGVVGVYDRHSYFDEKKEALEAWAQRLRSIVDPPPSNVVSHPAMAHR